PLREERQPRAGTHGPPVFACSRAGADGSGGNGVSCADPALRGVSARIRLPFPRASIRSAAEAVPLRRLVPATPRADVAPRDGVGASAGRPRPRGGPVPRPGRPRPAGPLWNESHTAVTVSDTRPWDNVTGA